jgi:hydrogenase maturation protease
MSSGRILVAGIGNILLGDDGFGSEVARELLRRPRAENVTVLDIGIRGLDLAYALLAGYETTILIDAVSRGGAPGTLYTIEPDLDSVDETLEISETLDAHNMNPLRVLRFARSMGAQCGRILIIGCEPATFGSEEGQIALSSPVSEAIDHAIQMVESMTHAPCIDQRREPAS